MVFLGTECPHQQLLSCRGWPSCTRNIADKGVAFLAINANRQDTPERVARHARKHEVPFPVLKDAGNKVADQFGARRTPEAFVLDAAGKVLYQGRIDDQFGIGYNRPGKPTRRDLAGRWTKCWPASRCRRPHQGGRLSDRPASRSRRRRDRHLRQARQPHLAEELPGVPPARTDRPDALLTYDDAVAWSDTIREVVQRAAACRPGTPIRATASSPTTAG